MEKIYTNLKKIGSNNGDIEFQAVILPETLEEYLRAALAEIAENFALPGFRKGKVPPEKVREYVGEMELLEEAANEALRNAMQGIAEDEHLDVIGRPQLVITKLAPKNPLEFKIKYALLPEISLPDYKKIGKNIFERKDPTDVSEKEIDEAIERIQKLVLSSTATSPATGAGEKTTSPSSPEPITDESVKKFGNFSTVADFRAELKKQLEREKELHMKDGRREEMIREIVKHTKIKVPQLLVDQELFEFLTDRDEQLKKAGLSLEEYLKQIGKTAEQLEKDERKLIEDDLTMSLTVQEIRKQEKISADDRAIHSLMATLKLRYPERDEATLHRTAEAMIVQDKLFTVLEGTPPKDEPKDSPVANVVENKEK